MATNRQHPTSSIVRIVAFYALLLSVVIAGISLGFKCFNYVTQKRRIAASGSSIKTVWGNEMIECPVIKSLLVSPVMERLKGVDQSGAVAYFGYTPFYRRYDHCVGVWSLVKRAGGPSKEQWAALLHDASHTTFSHVADLLFYTPELEHSYQDTIHLWFLEQMGVPGIISKHEPITLEELNPDREEYKRLERSLPDLCADRIEYILHTGLLWDKVTQEEFDAISAALQWDEVTQRWYFNNQEKAVRFAQLSLYFTEFLWGSPWNAVFNTYFSEILKRAMELGMVTKEQLHFGTDEEVLKIVKRSQDPYIQERLRWCADLHNSFSITTGDEYDLLHKPKFRGVNPWVQMSEGMKRLIEIDPDYANQFNELKNRLAQGIKIILKKSALT